MEFERFADDAAVHCAAERQALQVWAALSERLEKVLQREPQLFAHWAWMPEF